jgi:hypothetical protein
MKENEPKKGRIAKILDYLSCILKRKLLAFLLGVKSSELYTLQSSLKKDYYFILDKHTHTFLAVFVLGRSDMLVGYNDISKKIMDKKFEPLGGASERFLSETLQFVHFLDIASFKPVLTKTISHKYLLVINEVEYAIQKNTYTYEHEVDNVTHYYSQESYVTVKDNELMFFNTFPHLFLVSDKNDVIHKKALLNKNDTDPIIQNIDLDLIFDDLKLLISGKGLTKKGISVLHNYDKAINLMKDYYLNSHYHGWQEVGYPQTPEDVQLLKMIAI